MLHQKALCALALFCFSSIAAALEVGFESLVTANASDNVGGANVGEEQEGGIGYIQLGVFGSQEGTRVSGAFSGEISSSKRLDDPDDNTTIITQFVGAAEVQVTPRAFTWYVGDILGSVRSDDGFQSFDDADAARRNVFVTGPEFRYELDAFSRVNARFLYVNQSQDDETLESFYNSTASWSVDTDNGNTFGFSLSNVYTDNPKENLEGDFNRFSLAATWNRTRGRNTYAASLGGTRYDTKDESLNGANARIAYTRQLGPQTNFTVAYTQDLRDQTLSTVESLIAEGSGVESDADGFFDESRIDARYSFTSSVTTFDFGASTGLSDFRFIADDAGFTSAGDLEDRVNMSAYANYSYVFSPRTRLNTYISFTHQDYQNLDDNSQSVLGTLQLVRRLSRSFELQLGYRGYVSQGEATQNVLNLDSTVEEVEVTENRVTIGLRWAPPTRASKDLTVELKSLLQ